MLKINQVKLTQVNVAQINTSPSNTVQINKTPAKVVHNMIKKNSINHPNCNELYASKRCCRVC